MPAPILKGAVGFLWRQLALRDKRLGKCRIKIRICRSPHNEQAQHRACCTKDRCHAFLSLKQQFGDGYARMTDFKRVFRRTLPLVRAPTVYPILQITRSNDR